MFELLIGAALGAAAFYAYTKRAVIVGDIHTDLEAAKVDLENVVANLKAIGSKAAATSTAHAVLSSAAANTAHDAQALSVAMQAAAKKV